MLMLIVFLFVAALQTLAAIDTPTVPDKPYPNLRYYYTGRIGYIHTELSSSYSRWEAITLDVIVGPDGRVEDAHAVQGPREFFAEAEAVEKKRRFRPFQKNGKVVRASITDTVAMLPRELWGARTSFPEVTNWNKVEISLHRSFGYCMGCPAYSVEIQGDGSFTFEGIHPASIAGTFRGRISPRLLHALVEQFRTADYFSLRDRYAMNATDLETVRVSLAVDGKTKTVLDYGGLQVGMPEVVVLLQNAIDEATVAGLRKGGMSAQADMLESDIRLRH